MPVRIALLRVSRSSAAATNVGKSMAWLRPSRPARRAVVAVAAGAARQEMLVGDPVDALVLDLLDWVGRGERPYREVIEAWRTSCPRLPVWETANSRGLLEQRQRQGQETTVALSAKGLELLRSSRAAPFRPPGKVMPSSG
jgi:D-3-phosphoglycerate dehydrogenase